MGIIEPAIGWMASIFSASAGRGFYQQGDTEIFATELQATKWLHTQASALDVLLSR